MAFTEFRRQLFVECHFLDGRKQKYQQPKTKRLRSARFGL